LEPFEFNVPVQGEREDLTDRELPPQALRLCQNMWRGEDGNLNIRGGYQLLSATYPADRVMGIHYFKTAAGAHKLIAATLTKAWAYNYTTKIWEDVTGTALSGSSTDHVRFATFNTSGTFNALFVNGVNTPKNWDGTGNYTPLGGSPAGAPLDVKVAANRALFLRTPFNIQISDFNNPAVFPTGNGFNIALIDSGDFAIGMERFNRTSIAAFGEESQWVLRSQAGSIPFRVERISEFPGPLSSASLVVVNGAIYYLARDYNVYKFDGTGCMPVGYAMKSYVKASIDENNRTMAHGAFHDKFGKIIWLYPASGDSLPSIGVFLDVRTGEMGRVKYGTGITASARVIVSTGVTWADLSGYSWESVSLDYPTWDSFGTLANKREVGFGEYTGKVHISGAGNGSDNGAAIEAIWEVPLHSYGGWQNDFVPDTFETFFKKTTNSTTVSISCGSTNTLMDTPTYTPMGSFDLATDQRNDIDLTDMGQKRFLTVRHRAVALRGQVAWQGGLMKGQSAGIESGPVNE